MKKVLSTRAVGIFTWVLLLIAIPTGLYVSHVYDQLGEVRENNLRTLSKAADSTTQILQTALGNVRNLENNEEFVCEFLIRQPYLEWDGDGDCDVIDGMKERFKSTYLRADADGVQVVVEGPSDSGQPDSAENGYIFGVKLDSLLAAIPFSDALDLLLVADQSGKVVHQHKPVNRLDVGLNVSSLTGLPTGTKGLLINHEDLKRASSINRVLLSDVDYQMLCQPLALNLDGSGEATEEQSANEKNNSHLSEYWVLCGLVASERSLRSSLAVAPFLAVAFLAVTVFGFLTWPALKLFWMSKRDRLFFVDLCFLLVGTLGAVMLATVLILGVGSYRYMVSASEAGLNLLALQIEVNIEHEIDTLTAQLKRFDDALRMSVSHDKGNADSRYDDIENLYAIGSTKNSRAGVANSGDKRSALWQNELSNNANWPVKSDFEMMFWADCSGKQRFKATVLSKNTPRVNIGHRNYFKAANQDRMWPQSASAPDADTDRFVESVRSVTTGKFATVISRRSSVDMEALRKLTRKEKEQEDSPVKCASAGVAAVQATFAATSNAVLPPGVGFAVIEKDGTVVLHSDERRALFENLYEEMDDGDRLQSLVLARADGNLSTSYLGRPHQLFARPFQHMPWTVVTFSDNELVSTANLEVLGHATGLIFVFLLLYSTMALFYFLIRGPELPLWLWPGTHKGRIATWSLVIPAVALAAMLFLMVIESNDNLVLASFVVPFAVFFGIYIAYRRTDRRNQIYAKSDDVELPQVWVAISSALLVWIVTAIVPAGIFFNAALNNQSKLLVRYENEYLTEQIVRRNCAIDGDYRTIDRSAVCDDNSSDCVNESRRDLLAGDLYPSSIFWPYPLGEIEESQTAIRIKRNPFDPNDCRADEIDTSLSWRPFLNSMPIYNRTVARSRYLDSSPLAATANNTNWNWCVNNRGVAYFEAAPLPCGTTVHLVSGTLFGKQVYSDRAVIILGAMFLALLFFWARYGARTIFFGDLRRPPLQDRHGFENNLSKKENNSKVCLIAIAASQVDRQALLKPPTPRLTPYDQKITVTRGEHIRYDMTDFYAGSTRRMLLLENLIGDVKAGKNILLVSPVDPYSLLTSGDSIEDVDPSDTVAIQTARQSEEEMRQWRKVLAKFRVVIVSINKKPPVPVSTGIWQRELDDVVNKRWLKVELDAVPELKPLYQFLRRELIGTTRRNGLDRIVERAYGSYMAMWDACSEDEKLVLVQLAFENVVNPKQVSVVRRLIQRGLIVRDPGLRIVNQSFARFITQVQDPFEVSEWEQKTSGVSWVHKRWALLGVLLLGLLFLWATQRELFNTSIMFLSAAAVSLPGLIKIMSNLNRMGAQGNN